MGSPQCSTPRTKAFSVIISCITTGTRRSFLCRSYHHFQNKTLDILVFILHLALRWDDAQDFVCLKKKYFKRKKKIKGAATEETSY